MEALGKAKAHFLQSLVLGYIQHVAELLAPRRVVDLCHDVLNLISCWIEAVVETHRVESVAKAGQLCQQTNRP